MQYFRSYFSALMVFALIQHARAADCNTNHTSDTTEISMSQLVDCDTNGTPDLCDLRYGCDADCNTNGTLDVCDFSGSEVDCNTDGVPDVCQTFPNIGFLFVNNRSVTGNSPFSAAAGDVNGDNLPDLVVGDGLTGIDLILNLGSFTFDATTNIFNPGDVRSLQLFDMDGDNDRDIVCNDRSTGHIRIFNNNGSGVFTQGTPYGPFATTPTDVQVGDMDGDGDFDIVFAAESSSTLYVALNNGNATFAAAASYATAGVHTAEPGAMLLADLDNDGDLDVAKTCNGITLVQVFTNNGSGTLSAAVNISTVNMPRGIVAADTDCDGDLDLYVTLPQQFSVLRIRNNGGGSFGGLSTSYAGNSSFWLVAGDFDQDGDVDLISTHAVNGQAATYLRNLGDGSGFLQFYTFMFNAGNGQAIAADFNNDARLDFATPNPSNDAMTILFNVPYIGQEHFDCNSNNTLDDCEGGCNTNGIPDECEDNYDCNSNGTFDACDIAQNQTSEDCDFNGFPDECEYADCNTNGTHDGCDVFQIGSTDCDFNYVLDECEFFDCNTNSTYDGCEIFHGKGSTNDCNFNNTLDICEIFTDCNTNGEFDGCEFNDCDGNGTPDACDIANGMLADLNCNGTWDDCEYGCYSCSGDVNNDYYVDGQDIQCFINWLYAPHSFSQYICADMDGDGDVTQADIPLFVNRLLNGSTYCF